MPYDIDQCRKRGNIRSSYARMVFGLFALGLASCTDNKVNNTVNENTLCSVMSKAVDGHDKAAVKLIAAYQIKVLNFEDGRNVEQGKFSLLAPLSKAGFDNTLASALGVCDKHPATTIHDATIKVYDLFRSMRETVVGPQ